MKKESLNERQTTANHTRMRVVQETQLRHLEEQDEHEGTHRASQVLQVVQGNDTAQRDALAQEVYGSQF